MKFVLWLCMACVVVLTSAIAVATGDDDAKLLQGKWSPVKAELAGQPMPDEVLKTISLKIDDGKYEVFVGDEPDRGTCTSDSTTTPKSMTITGTDGPNKGKTFEAIYEISGDTLRVCYDLSGEKRPTEFKTVAGTQMYLVTYKRQTVQPATSQEVR